MLHYIIHVSVHFLYNSIANQRIILKLKKNYQNVKLTKNYNTIDLISGLFLLLERTFKCDQVILF